MTRLFVGQPRLHRVCQIFIINKTNNRNAELLKVTNMQTCVCANFAQFAQNVEIYTAKLEISCNYAISTCVFLLVFTPLMWRFKYLLHIFLRKIFKCKVFPVQENQLLESLQKCYLNKQFFFGFFKKNY